MAWWSRERSSRPPSASGSIGGIDRWVTQQAVRLIEAHKREGRDLILEVNLSGRTMGDERFPDDVKASSPTPGSTRPG